jgi:hypothetical protein
VLWLQVEEVCHQPHHRTQGAARESTAYAPFHHTCMHLDNNKASIWLTVKANIRGLPKCTQLHGANVVAKASDAEAKACNMLARDKQ